MKQINPNIYPSGGYYFKESDGSTHSADSWNGVIARVKGYRERQGRPVGDVKAEVIFQACLRNPVLCKEDNGVTQQAQVQVSLKGRILQWLSAMRGIKEKGGVRFVSADLQAARTDVCLRCPVEKGLPEGCGSCRAALNALREDIVGKRGYDARLSACSMMEEYLPVSTWVDLDCIIKPELPPECWRKRTL